MLSGFKGTLVIRGRFYTSDDLDDNIYIRSIKDIFVGSKQSGVNPSVLGVPKSVRLP